MVIVDNAVHPFASCTCTVMAPTPAFDSVRVVAAVTVVPPVVLLTTLKVYGEVPPPAVKVPEPVVLPLHSKATLPVFARVNAGGAVILIVDWIVQPFASWACTVIEPTPALDKVKVVAVVAVVPPVVLLTILNV